MARSKSAAWDGSSRRSRRSTAGFPPCSRLRFLRSFNLGKTFAISALVEGRRTDPAVAGKGPKPFTDRAFDIFNFLTIFGVFTIRLLLAIVPAYPSLPLPIGIIELRAQSASKSRFARTYM